MALAAAGPGWICPRSEVTHEPSAGAFGTLSYGGTVSEFCGWAFVEGLWLCCLWSWSCTRWKGMFSGHMEKSAGAGACVGSHIPKLGDPDGTLPGPEEQAGVDS